MLVSIKIFVSFQQFRSLFIFFKLYFHFRLYNNMYPLLTKVCNEIAFSKPLKKFQKVYLMHVMNRHNVITILPTSMGTIWYFKWLHLHCKRSSNWLVQFVKFWHPNYIFFYKCLIFFFKKLRSMKILVKAQHWCSMMVIFSGIVCYNKTIITIVLMNLD